jgi:hypothetical protein
VLDSVRVVEADSLLFGRPIALASDKHGGVFVSDASDGRVLHIDARGVVDRSVSRSGGGPGEIRNAGGLAMLGDSLLAVLSAGRSRLEVFDARTGAHRWGRALSSPQVSIAPGRTGVLIGAVDLISGTAWQRVVDSVGSAARGGIVPSIYRRLPMLVPPVASLVLDEREETVVGMFEGTDTLYAWRPTGPIETMALIPKVRRGSSAERFDALVREPARAAELAFQWSVPMAISALTDSSTAIVFLDPVLGPKGFSGAHTLTVVDWRSRRTCVEQRVPVPSDPQPRMAFIGDTLLALVQHADSSTDMAHWLVRMSVRFCGGADGPD